MIEHHLPKSTLSMSIIKTNVKLLRACFKSEICENKIRRQDFKKGSELWQAFITYLFFCLGLASEGLVTGSVALSFNLLFSTFSGPM